MIDIIISIVSPIIAIVALYFSLRKQPHEITKLDSEATKLDSEAANADADTIKTLYALIRELEERNKAYKKEQEELYTKLQSDFKAYKAEMTSQLVEVVNENAKLRKWAKKLASQLEQAGIIPTAYE
jgi:alanyl-tRNA synthetase